ncbi:O-antigen ligase family protein [Solirubrobacter phytolaccae]|uniref:O-antigen ligase family protein n=1 Tax=Solirubrobacter phytolaccae TaxID=1404360 RepID=A0A9X3N6B9_9ACTN|nr:O-antigen ligase family protein [Solirubrobacter phytolaccae]MDA0180316.1 O-antigen ligase family protein [Solirubrobacter phytolaccae]
MISSGAAPAPAIGRRSRTRGTDLALWILAGFGVVTMLAAGYAGLAVPALAAVVLPLALISYQKALLSWQTLLGLILAVILFIPIRRYTVGGGFPIELEPYRVVIAVVMLCWFGALLIDPDVRWRGTGLEGPVTVFLMAILLSLVLNLSKVAALSEAVLKQVSFFISFILMIYFVGSSIRRGPEMDRILRLIVLGGAFVALLSLYEWKSGRNMFNGLGAYLPFLQYVDQGEALARGTGTRAMGSAQHPIALGAALVMLLPLTLYLHRRDGHWIWLASGGLLTLGALSTGSRTAAVMLMVTLAVFFWLKREETIKLLPALFVLMCVIQVAMPGTLGTFKAILNPAYVVQEQSQEMGSGSGRLHDIGPSLDEWSRNPFFGQGFGTRIVATDGAPDGAQILDNQWLGSLLDVGFVGFVGLIWLYVRAVRKLGRRARAETGADGWLPTTLAASITAFAVGMFTYDAFAFVQVTFLSFVFLGFAAVIVRPDNEPSLLTRLRAQSRRQAVARPAAR